MPALRWTVSQIGARQHYGIPRGFELTGSLRTLYTDFWCRRGRRLLSRGPLFTRGLAGRFHPGIPADKVISFNRIAILDALRSRKSENLRDGYLGFIRIGAEFCRRVNRSLEKTPLEPGRDAFFGFNTGALETLELMRSRGILAVVDQIDPGIVEDQMVREEETRWPGWAVGDRHIPTEYFQRSEQEWAQADFIVVNSQWSASALRQRGVLAEKLIVAPVAYEPHESSPPPTARPRPANTPLRVLWLGTVNLRKGIPYLIEAAKLLRAEAIEFIIAGPLDITEFARSSAPASVSFLGRVSRSDAARLYRDADVFVLPTISDGFAITQLEAMAQGLPVITTPNCGQVVTPGVDGLVVPAQNAVALAEAVLKLHRDRSLLAELAGNTADKVARFALLPQTQFLEKAIKSRADNVILQPGGNPADAPMAP